MEYLAQSVNPWWLDQLTHQSHPPLLAPLHRDETLYYTYCILHYSSQISDSESMCGGPYCHSCNWLLGSLGKTGGIYPLGHPTSLLLQLLWWLNHSVFFFLCDLAIVWHAHCTLSWCVFTGNLHLTTSSVCVFLLAFEVHACLGREDKEKTSDF